MVNLELLMNSLIGFFSRKGCVCRFVKDAECFKIYVKLSGGKTVMIKISGSPDNFKVEFIREEQRFLQFFGNMVSMFGGGVFVSRATERDDLNCFEDEFWVFIEDVVKALSGSAKA
jgi:hypothetical protein